MSVIVVMLSEFELGMILVSSPGDPRSKHALPVDY
jgi:hypothetical protein